MNKRYLEKLLLNFHLGPGNHPSGSSQDVHAGDAGAGSAKAPSKDMDNWPGYEKYADGYKIKYRGSGNDRTGYYEVKANAQWIAETEKSRIMVGIRGPYKGKVIITEENGSSHGAMIAWYNDHLEAQGLPRTNGDDWTHFYNNFIFDSRAKADQDVPGLSIDINYAGEVISADADFPKGLDNITKSTRALKNMGLPADYPLRVRFDWKRYMPTTVGDLAIHSTRFIELLLSLSYDATQQMRKRQEYYTKMDDFHLGPGNHPSGSDQDVHAGDAAAGSAKAPGKDLADWPGYNHYGGDEYRAGYYEITENAQWIAESENSRVMVGIRGTEKGKVIITEKKGSSHAEMIAYYNDYLESQGLPETDLDDWTHFYNNFRGLDHGDAPEKGLWIDIQYAGEVVSTSDPDNDFPAALENITKSTRVLEKLGLPADYPMFVKLDWKRGMPTTVGDLVVAAGAWVELHLGPGNHPSGSDQDVHAGDAAAGVAASIQRGLLVSRLRHDPDARAARDNISIKNSWKELDNYEERAYWITPDKKILASKGYQAGGTPSHTLIMAKYITENPNDFGDTTVTKATAALRDQEAENSFIESEGFDKGFIKVRDEETGTIAINVPESMVGIENVWDDKSIRENRAKQIARDLDRRSLLPDSYSDVTVYSNGRYVVNIELDDLQMPANSLLDLHLGPGNHPSGSSQDVHGGVDAGARGGVVARQATEADIAKIKMGSGDGKKTFDQMIGAFKIPAEHLDGIDEIKFTDGTLIKSVMADGRDGFALGTYDANKNIIEIAHNVEGKSVIAAGTLQHEIGHHVHLSKMDVPTSKEWASISDNGRNAKISAYARTNTGEHFAEAYRVYYSGAYGKEQLKQWEPATYDFMKDKISRSQGLFPAGEISFSSWQVRYNPEQYSRYNKK